MTRARVDFEEKTVVAGIRELVEPARESARGIGILPLLRAELGREVHERYRRARELEFPEPAPEPGGAVFRAEVGVRLSHEVDGFRALVRGRADGVLRVDTPGQPSVSITVEEVKSMALGAREIHALPLEAVSDHALQARLYALALHREEPAADIRARLILVSILDDYQRTVDVDFSVVGAERALERLLRRALAEAEDARRLVEKRVASAGDLVFPYERMRPRQDRLIAGMRAGLDRQRPVLAWAPTGIGKTVSALYAGLGFALERGASLFFATAKTTQQALVARTFEDLSSAAPAFARRGVRAVTMRAKERMCPPGDLFCHPDVCPYLADFSARANERDAVAELVEEGEAHVTPERIYQYGLKSHLCPFELSLRVAARAELVIADYNYVYDPGVALAPFSDQARASTAAVVVDEGHNLLDRARDYHSVFIARARVDEVRARLAAGAYLGETEKRRPGRGRAHEQLSMAGAADEAGRGSEWQLPGPRLFRELDELCAEIRALIESTMAACLPGPGRTRRRSPGPGRAPGDECATIARDAETWSALAERAVRALLAFALYARARRLVFPRDPLPELLREIVRMRDAVAGDEPELIPYVAGERAPDGPGLGVLCVDPGPRLAARHARALGTVVMSATLNPLPYYAEVLGFSAMNPVLGRVASPFPAHNRAVVIVPTVHTGFRQRRAYVTDIARLIGDIVAARPGRYIAFFSSFAFLAQVERALVLPRSEILVQSSSMDQAARRDILERLCQSPGPALLMAVSGGVFAEGVDLPGDRLIGAIVVGPSLPSVGFERSLMRAYHDQRGRDGFAYAMLFPGMQRVIQSAGRVIRSMDDRGIIALLGTRFTQRGYADLVPPDWYARDIRELVTVDPGARLSSFWAGFNPHGHLPAGHAPDGHLPAGHSPDGHLIDAPGDPPPDPRTLDHGLR